jgi:hypothetical protein
MKMFSICTLAVLASLGLVDDAGATAGSASVPALHDAMIFGTITTRASGEGPGMFAGADSNGNVKRGLVTFNLGSAHIPSGATIESVTMSLVLGQVGGAGMGGSGGAYPTRIISIYHLTKAWSEGTSGSPTSKTMGGTGSGYPAGSGDVTWIYADDPSSSWTTHGGDYTATALASHTFAFPFTLGSTATWSSTAMVNEVKNWVTTPSSYNGWIIESNLEADDQSFLGWWTKDGAAANSNSALAPKLTITWM